MLTSKNFANLTQILDGAPGLANPEVVPSAPTSSYAATKEYLLHSLKSSASLTADALKVVANVSLEDSASSVRERFDELLQTGLTNLKHRFPLAEKLWNAAEVHDSQWLRKTFGEHDTRIRDIPGMQLLAGLEQAADSLHRKFTLVQECRKNIDALLTEMQQSRPGFDAQYISGVHVSPFSISLVIEPDHLMRVFGTKTANHIPKSILNVIPAGSEEEILEALQIVNTTNLLDGASDIMRAKSTGDHPASIAKVPTIPSVLNKQWLELIEATYLPEFADSPNLVRSGEFIEGPFNIDEALKLSSLSDRALEALLLPDAHQNFSLPPGVTEMGTKAIENLVKSVLLAPKPPNELVEAIQACRLILPPTQWRRIPELMERYAQNVDNLVQELANFRLEGKSEAINALFQDPSFVSEEKRSLLTTTLDDEDHFLYIEAETLAEAHWWRDRLEQVASLKLETKHLDFAIRCSFENLLTSALDEKQIEHALHLIGTADSYEEGAYISGGKDFLESKNLIDYLDENREETQSRLETLEASPYWAVIEALDLEDYARGLKPLLGK